MTINLRRNTNFKVNLMGHVIAHDFQEKMTEKMVQVMVDSGASVIELQVPFSEPTADGPIFLAANHRALNQGATLESSLGLAARLVQKFGDRCDFLVMTYLNIPYQRGYKTWAKDLRERGIKGTIIPDLPVEFAVPYEEALGADGIFNVRLIAPHGDLKRTEQILKGAKGLVYAVARKGVTGAASSLDKGLLDYLIQLRALAPCPLALGFGIQSGEAVHALAPYVDWVVVGTASLVAWQNEGEFGLQKLWTDLAQKARC